MEVKTNIISLPKFRRQPQVTRIPHSSNAVSASQSKQSFHIYHVKNEYETLLDKYIRILIDLNKKRIDEFIINESKIFHISESEFLNIHATTCFSTFIHESGYSIDEFLDHFANKVHADPSTEPEYINVHISQFQRQFDGKISKDSINIWYFPDINTNVDNFNVVGRIFAFQSIQPYVIIQLKISR